MTLGLADALYIPDQHHCVICLPVTLLTLCLITAIAESSLLAVVFCRMCCCRPSCDALRLFVWMATTQTYVSDQFDDWSTEPTGTAVASVLLAGYLLKPK